MVSVSTSGAQLRKCTDKRATVRRTKPNAVCACKSAQTYDRGSLCFGRKGDSCGGFSLTEGVCNHRISDENYHCAQSQPIILLQMTGSRVAVSGNLRQTDLGYLPRKLDKINNVDCNNSTMEKKCWRLVTKLLYSDKTISKNNLIRFPGVISADVPCKLQLAAV